MSGNHNDRRKAKNGRRSSAERKAAKNNGRSKSQKANGGSGRSAGSLIAIGGAEDREDTKIILSYIAERIGSGAVYVVDGHDLSYTNVSEVSFNRAMSVFGVKLHTPSNDDRSDMHSRQPAHAGADVEYLDVESQLLKGAALTEALISSLYDGV